MGEFVSVPHHNGIPGDSLACGILSRGIQLFVGTRGTANLGENEMGRGRRAEDQAKSYQGLRLLG